MTNGADVERIASCACGRVRIRAAGAPIISSVCYCDDCQAAVRQLEAAGARSDFHDAWNGTGYTTYRNDRLACVEGQSLLQGFKLHDSAPTTRYVTTCCQSAMYLRYRPGWWTSLYRARLDEAAPPIEMRSKVGRAKDRIAIPNDVPHVNGFPLRLFARLARARVAMWFG